GVLAERGGSSGRCRGLHPLSLTWRRSVTRVRFPMLWGRNGDDPRKLEKNPVQRPFVQALGARWVERTQRNGPMAPPLLRTEHALHALSRTSPNGFGCYGPTAPRRVSVGILPYRDHHGTE